MINKIGKVTLYVSDQQEAKKFWTEKVGFVVKLEQAMGPGMTWLEVAPTADEFTTFVLYNKQAMATQDSNINTGHPSILLSTTDIDSAYNEMKNNGVKVDELIKMPYANMFSFYDQDGNKYMLREDN